MRVVIETNIQVEPGDIVAECTYEEALAFIQGIETEIGDTEFLRMIYEWAKKDLDAEGMLEEREENGDDLSAEGEG